VVIPLNLNFTIDPFEISTVGGNQIAPAEYRFINQSNVPVLVSLDIRAVLGDGMRFVDSPWQIDKTDTDPTAKYMFFAIINAGNLIPLCPEDNSASVAFELGTQDGNVGAFSFYANMNPYVKWNVNDLDFVAVYDIRMLSNLANSTEDADVAAD
jgi:hypothetical protein